MFIGKKKTGLVLSGGGTRAAYQIGALKALIEKDIINDEELSVIIGASIGAVNSVVLSGCISLGLESARQVAEEIWAERTYKNTFQGHISLSFLRSLQVAVLRYTSPGPIATSLAIFDPTPLQDRIDGAIAEYGSDHSLFLQGNLDAAAVMTTVEGIQRRPMVFTQSRTKISDSLMQGAFFDVTYVNKLRAAHGMASAALPSVLPPVELDLEDSTVHLVDGGICNNIPVDPAVRLGANEIIILDVSGRKWWHDQYDEPYYIKPTWEVPAKEASFCMCPFNSLEVRNRVPMGRLLKEAIGTSTSDYIKTMGPTWPVFKILKMKMGEMLAYEVMSYVTIHPEYTTALIEAGYNETLELLKGDYEDMVVESDLVTVEEV